MRVLLTDVACREGSKHPIRGTLRCGVCVQYIFNHYNFARPFFLTYVSNSMFIILHPYDKLQRLVQARGYCVSREKQSADQWTLWQV
jgi:hypothetical protein